MYLDILDIMDSNALTSHRNSILWTLYKPRTQSLDMHFYLLIVVTGPNVFQPYCHVAARLIARCILHCVLYKKHTLALIFRIPLSPYALLIQVPSADRCVIDP